MFFLNIWRALLFFLALFLLPCYLFGQQDNVATLKNYIAAEYKRMYPELEIESISLITRNTLDLYAITIISKSLNATKSPNGYLSLNYKHNNRLMQDSVRYTINGRIRVYVATENIRAGSNIGTHSFTDRVQDFTTFAITPASKAEILHASAKVYIPMNTILYRNKLAKKMLVTKDSQVKIIFRSDGIEAISNGKALQNGVQGDMIKVENIESRRTIIGEVIDENVVRIY